MTERRSAPRRRLRDRIASGTTPGALAGKGELRNLLLLIEDDLRESALALAAVEAYLGRARALVERPAVAATELSQLAGEEGVVERLEALRENVDSLRRRMGQAGTTVARGGVRVHPGA
ncbi:MAG: hypothetical protein EXR72_14925 [Myxococcales bacterium]|nr:hypothetical protein [Myxococcales bacterium]